MNNTMIIKNTTANTTETKDLKTLTANEQNALFSKYHHKNRPDDIIVVCGCDNSSPMKIRLKKDKTYSYYPSNSLTHKEGCIHHKDMYADEETVDIETENGKREGVKFRLKRRPKKKAPIDIDPDDNEQAAIENLDGDEKAKVKILESNSLQSIFTKVINGKHKKNLEEGKQFSFDKFFRGLDYNFKLTLIGKETIYKKIESGRLIFGVVKKIEPSFGKYSIQIEPMKFLPEKFKYGATQYITISEEEFDYAAEYYKALNVDLIKAVESNPFYFVGIGVKDGETNKTAKIKLSAINGYFMAMDKSGIIVDSLFEAKVYNNLHDNDIKFYKPLSINYEGLNFEEYNGLADAIVVQKSGYAILECFGRTDGKYLTSKHIKIDNGNKINENHSPNIKFDYIERDKYEEQINSLIQRLKE